MSGAESGAIGHTVVNLIELGIKLMERLERAHRLAMEDVNRCKADLGVAADAIFGLENEYIGIINQGRHFNRNSPQELRGLQIRLDNYLTQDNICRHLQGALNDLGRYRELLSRRAEKFWQWPWKKQDRRRAVSEFAELIQEFRDYYNRLEVRGLALVDNPSGFNWFVLLQLKKYLANPDDQRTPPQVIEEITSTQVAMDGKRFSDETSLSFKRLVDAFE